MDRYMLDQDGDGLWYVIPASMQKEFDQWVQSGWWEVPEWAKPVDGPHAVTFTDPSW